MFCCRCVRERGTLRAGAGIVISGRNEEKLSSIAASLPGAVAVPADATAGLSKLRVKLTHGLKPPGCNP